MTIKTAVYSDYFCADLFWSAVLLDNQSFCAVHILLKCFSTVPANASNIDVTGQQNVDACVHCCERCWPSCYYCRYEGNL